MMDRSSSNAFVNLTTGFVRLQPLQRGSLLIRNAIHHKFSLFF
jgi:hypothetical protein